MKIFKAICFYGSAFLMGAVVAILTVILHRWAEKSLLEV